MMAVMYTEPHLLVSHLRELTPASARVCADSRQIQKGDIFFAYSVGHGNALRDGRHYINAALENGAAAIVFDPSGDIANSYLEHPQCFAIENLASLAGPLCAQWYGYPGDHLQVIGVTGTNGKTTITQWLAQAIDEKTHRVGLLGTLGTGFVDCLVRSGYTTPDAPRLQTQLKEFVDAGASQVVMEISSHALDQGRVAGLVVECAVFTNLTQDHLDYHGTMSDYAEAKATLFQRPGLLHAVINFDDAFGRELATRLLAKNGPQVWGYALSQDAFTEFEKFGDRLKRTYTKNSAVSAVGYESVLSCEGIDSALVQLPIIGGFNLSNCLAVWTVLLSQGFPCEKATKRITKLRPVSGRMELIQFHSAHKTAHPFIVVDYAHTPDALAKTLDALRPIANQRGGKIWCVFGCGGDRDTGKRSKMGSVAQEFADHVIVTSDNPRSEEPDAIIAMIKAGMTADVKNVQFVSDRAAAIMAAVRHADAKDVVLIAGKGHEFTQEINGKKFDFSDQEHVQLAAGRSV
ncbi:UDP-N-acetylmuramoylalanyl-D-glutamate--2,6-diaminopimelate ligase [Polynucleobacter brandtiae]|uniref:UDP-N-acetylmuramoyl-L-alanyl-D-glutamate--2,6-diaminopimelate ligase n=2 Tax=Polynucleobacter brandtiae TaxID=1938816 RepID=A0A2M8VRI4_9BURK|nr:UDP-N-acetylmuramoyl-L-alanyl-D-glutamate--2,6-diaminopimelate ligase [Polynucleobacter brandtiae]PJI80068.1 UDP-N-acetylmuramoylalanyl-D-glutamate--2,6-diaminopimelate ligase [Polynucleobacter brandtiae]